LNKLSFFEYQGLTISNTAPDFMDYRGLISVLQVMGQDMMWGWSEFCTLFVAYSRSGVGGIYLFFF
jgi:hypothetical protein